MGSNGSSFSFPGSSVISKVSPSTSSSDVPLGVSLSAGLFSSSFMCLCSWRMDVLVLLETRWESSPIKVWVTPD
jgi:hypothetical protein